MACCMQSGKNIFQPDRTRSGLVTPGIQKMGAFTPSAMPRAPLPDVPAIKQLDGEAALDKFGAASVDEAPASEAEMEEVMSRADAASPILFQIWGAKF